jgi:ATP phosphoribosyltransferase regulatory subunit HisZ
MTFNADSVSTVFDKVISFALATGDFDSVNGHEPKSAPGNGITCAVWAQMIEPIRAGGLAMTSGRVTLEQRIYTNFIQQPFDAIDPNVMAAVANLMDAYSGDFNFGGDAEVRNVDLLGAYGTALSAQAGYIDIDKKIYRVMTLTVPVIINDMFAQVA